ncbi:MAG: hypothetical protein K8S99_15970 [Planctomycetes bacterium]|nr:hypothetical protein [Planctomycetota bacterium]
MNIRFDDNYPWNDRHDPTDDAKAMIAETAEFLSWALSDDRGLPSIPRRRVDDGGFDFVSTHEGARALAERWWKRILEGANFGRY